MTCPAHPSVLVESPSCADCRVVGHIAMQSRGYHDTKRNGVPRMNVPYGPADTRRLTEWLRDNSGRLLAEIHDGLKKHTVEDGA